jgi:hypothetical protein
MTLASKNQANLISRSRSNRKSCALMGSPYRFGLSGPMQLRAVSIR